LVDDDEGHTSTSDQLIAHAVAFAADPLSLDLGDSMEIVPYAVPNPKPNDAAPRVLHDDTHIAA
jgi:hypothetical protein